MYGLVITTCQHCLAALQRIFFSKNLRLLWKSRFTRIFFVENSPKPVMLFWSSILCVFCLYTLLNVVGYYDLSVLSMSVMGFQKKFVCGWVG